MPGIVANAYYQIEAKTAAYQIRESDLGKLFTTVGAIASVTFTLPVTTTIQVGWWCEFFQAADQDMVIASYGSLDNITFHNDLTADTITFSTATELIGNAVRVVWDGTSWLSFLMAEETVTVVAA
jgi:hypothetical protein